MIRETIMAVALALGLRGQGMVNVAMCESTLNPLAVSTGGLRGLFQLGYGHIQRFYSQGYDDWTDPEQITDYTGHYVLIHGWGEWTCGWRYYQ